MFRWLCSLSCCGHVSPPNDIWLDPRSRGRFLEQTATWTCFIATYFCPDISEQACALLSFGLLGWLRTPHNFCPLGWSYMQSHAQTQIHTYASTQRSSLHIYLCSHTCTYTHTHTHSLTHMHARTKAHTKIQSYTGTQREKLTSNFHRISQAENNIALYLVPGSVHSPRDVETNLKDLQLHYEICLHTHTKNRACCFYSQTEHTVFTLKQVIHNFFFLMPYQLGWFFQG